MADQNLFELAAPVKEEWRPIPGRESRYHVSSFGRVKRLGNRGRPCILKGYLNRQGYLCVSLRTDRSPGWTRLHKLVAAVFLGPCPDGLEVNHKNGVKKDNHASNLEYCTRKENIRHARAMGLQGYASGRRHGTRTHPDSYRGERNSRAKLTADQVREIRALASTMTYPAIGKQFGISGRYVEDIVGFRTWKHVTEGVSNVA